MTNRRGKEYQTSFRSEAPKAAGVAPDTETEALCARRNTHHSATSSQSGIVLFNVIQSHLTRYDIKRAVFRTAQSVVPQSNGCRAISLPRSLSSFLPSRYITEHCRCMTNPACYKREDCWHWLSVFTKQDLLLTKHGCVQGLRLQQGLRHPDVSRSS